MTRFLPAICLLISAPLLADIRGIVLSERGEPIPKIVVTAFRPELERAAVARLMGLTMLRPARPVVAAATTDWNGRFALPTALNGQLEIAVRDLRFIPFKGYFDTTDHAVTIVLQRATTVSGSIRANEKPVAGASIMVFSLGGVFWETRSDRAGAFSIPDPSLWAGNFWIFHPDLGLTVRQVSKDTGLVFRMDDAKRYDLREEEAGATITGRILDGERKPLSGIIVNVSGDQQAISDASGRYTIAHLPPGRYTLYFDAFNAFAARSASIDLRQTEKATHDFSARRFALVRGSVKDYDGTPVGGAWIDAWPENESETFKPTTCCARRSLTARDGRFQVRFATFDGQLVLHATHPARPRAAAGPITIRKDVPTNITLNIPKGVEIKGEVVDEDGKPLPDVALAITPAGTSDALDPRSVATDAAGHFSARVTRDVIVDLSKEGFVKRRLKIALLDEPQRVVLTRAVEVRGRVLRSDGKAFEGAMVGLQKGAAVRWEQTDDHGEFVVKGIPAGEYEIAAMTPAGQMRQKVGGGLPEGHQTVRAPASNVVLTLVDDSVEVAGSVVDASSGKPIEAFSIRPEGMNFVGRGGDGQFDLGKLAAGETTLVVSADGYISTRQMLNLEPGKALRDLVIKLTRGRTVRGRITDATGKPLGNVRVFGDVSIRGEVDRSIELFINTWSEEDGTYELSGLVFSEFNLEFAKKEYSSLRKVVSAGQDDQTIDVMLSR